MKRVFIATFHRSFGSSTNNPVSLPGNAITHEGVPVVHNGVQVVHSVTFNLWDDTDIWVDSDVWEG